MYSPLNRVIVFINLALEAPGFVYDVMMHIQISTGGL